MNINGTTHNLTLELKIKGNKDANKSLEMQSFNPVYVDAYNATMSLNGYSAAESDTEPSTNNKAFMKAYNEFDGSVITHDDRNWSSY